MKCDKLKDYSIIDIEAIDDERYKKEKAPGKWVPESRVYLKTEVDSAIDELKRDHHRERHEYIEMVAKQRAEFFKRERRHKYKRCLAMARIAQDDWHLHNSFYAMGHQEFEKRKCEFYDKWRKRWLAIAEKFNEAK